MLKLAVVIANYNYSQFIQRAIDSVVSQSFGRVDLIIVDDGSTDNSWELIKLNKIEKSFRVPNGGANKACLYALERTTAPFVLILDADDELAPGCLNKILPLLDASVSKIQYSLLPIDSDNNIIGQLFPNIPDYKSGQSLADEVVRTGHYNTPPTSGNVFRRDVIDVLREVDYEMSVDGVTLFLAPFLGEVINLREPLGFYRIHDKNFSQSGARPSPFRFKQEADRFVVRLEHLKRTLAKRNIDVALPNPKSLSFYLERRVYQHVLEGKHVSYNDVFRSVYKVFGSNNKMINKIGTCIALLACKFCSVELSRKILKYRISSGNKTAMGLLTVIFSKR